MKIDDKMLLAEANQWPEDARQYLAMVMNATWLFIFP
jgi:hypothetical protein